MNFKLFTPVLLIVSMYRTGNMPAHAKCFVGIDVLENESSLSSTTERARTKKSSLNSEYKVVTSRTKPLPEKPSVYSSCLRQQQKEKPVQKN